MQYITIVLADAQYLTRQGLRRLLDTHAQFDVVAEASNEQELMSALMVHQPQVVILDYNALDSFSHDTITRIKQANPTTNLLVISEDNEKESIYRVLENGVNCFLTKTCDEEEIIDAIKATVKNEKFFCTKVLDYLLEKSFSKNIGCAPTPLTPRETEIVKLVAQGLIAKEIADMLCLSTHTVYTHRKNIMKKLNLNTSSELVLYAVQNGIVENSKV